MVGDIVNPAQVWDATTLNATTGTAEVGDESASKTILKIDHLD
jgi:hypothetical protein